MKTVALLALSLAAESCIATAIGFRPDPVALAPNAVVKRSTPTCSFVAATPKGKLVHCNTFGTLGKPAPLGQPIPNVATVNDCRSKCYLSSGCVSLGYNQTGSSCQLYGQNLIQQKINKSHSGSVVYNNRRCFKKACPTCPVDGPQQVVQNTGFETPDNTGNEPADWANNTFGYVNEQSEAYDGSYWLLYFSGGGGASISQQLTNPLTSQAVDYVFTAEVGQNNGAPAGTYFATVTLDGNTLVSDQDICPSDIPCTDSPGNNNTFSGYRTLTLSGTLATLSASPILTIAYSDSGTEEPGSLLDDVQLTLTCSNTGPDRRSVTMRPFERRAAAPAALAPRQTGRCMSCLPQSE